MTKLLSVLTWVLLITVTAQAQLDEAKNAFKAGAEAVNNGNLEEAIDSFYEALDLLDQYGEEDEVSIQIRDDIESRLPQLNLQLGTNYAKENEDDKAIETLENTIVLANDYNDIATLERAKNILSQLYYREAVGYYKKSQFEPALTKLNKAIDTDATFLKALYLEAVIYKKQENDAALEKTAKAAMNTKGDDETVEKIKSLAHSYFLKKGNSAKSATNYDEAIKFINKSITYDESNNLAYLLLLQCYSSQKNWDEVIETANTALKFEDDDEKKAGIYFELGKAYAGQGDTQAACDAYNNAAVGKYESNANYQMEHVLNCN
ncbi:MAG: tetratricopeptide repeat protein [Bacteroidetes bacterium]|jgi:tetratricopeptide (TPR) repeat protein|nr:tetratricopeptide repeat protein [Bacteroidota bacterium]